MASTDPAIRVSSLGKRYVLRHAAQRSDTLRDAIGVGARSLWRRLVSRAAGTREDFWALRDIGFTIEPGETVGIIGRNGAGKSTLLKLLTRITEPTEGRIELSGRVASLLEVGTGFHPELSGRENVYLNGAMLGLTRAEIRTRFDDIVAFAEVERFLDTPVKRYSSGMYVRLAFAVAAHLEPEILLVDEVLAVGDAAFQQKCLARMESAASGEGRTVLFVSHNLAAVRRLCRRSLYLDQGRLRADGPSEQIEDQFLADISSGSGAGTAGTVRQRDERFTVTSFGLHPQDPAVARAGERVRLRIAYRCSDPAAFADGAVVSVLLYMRGQKVVNLWSRAGRGHPFPVQAQGEILCELPRWPFRAGLVRVDLHVAHRLRVLLEWEEALLIESHDGDFYGTGTMPHESEGFLCVPHSWSP